MQKPVIELKNISHNERLSEETNAYSATLYVDGAKWGEVGNAGHGGSDHFHGVAGKNYGDVTELDKRIAATYPPALASDEFNLPASLESVCGQVLTAWLIAKDMRRAMGRKVLFTKPDKPGHVWEMSLKQKGRTWAVDQVGAFIAKNYPGAVILNDLPEAEALALYQGSGFDHPPHAGA